MELNEIKKSLYKEKPTAMLVYVNKNTLVYETSLANNQIVVFIIPLTDLGDANFYSEMDAKLLIRWISKPTNI